MSETRTSPEDASPLQAEAQAGLDINLVNALEEILACVDKTTTVHLTRFATIGQALEEIAEQCRGLEHMVLFNAQKPETQALLASLASPSEQCLAADSPAAPQNSEVPQSSEIENAHQQELRMITAGNAKIGRTSQTEECSNVPQSLPVKIPQVSKIGTPRHLRLRKLALEEMEHLRAGLASGPADNQPGRQEVPEEVARSFRSSELTDARREKRRQQAAEMRESMQYDPFAIF
ncbi:hypothetical protein TWF696_002106 [Orbilia brochopaga]|uniref:Uncharacterized protein n=1 Tax=Orbilia brochopaga TaxID=3140254 RepID=A0AAV9U9E7_9PEZI